MMKINKVIELPLSDSAYSNPVVRLNNIHIGKGKIVRRTPLHIVNPANGQSTIRYAMGNGGTVKGLTKDAIAVDYDATVELGISFKDESVELEVKPASIVQSFVWLMNSPDVNVRLNTRLALIGFVLGVIGFFASFF